MKKKIEMIERFMNESRATVGILTSTHCVVVVEKISETHINDIAVEDMKFLGFNYAEVDVFGRGTQGGMTAKEEIKDYAELLEIITDTLDYDGHISFGECEHCGGYFISGDHAYRINDGEYLCESCHSVAYPTNKDWYIRICEEVSKDGLDYENVWTREELEKMTEEELCDLSNEIVEDPDCVCYFTQA